MNAAWRNRITGQGTEAPDQLLANPRNWRIHGKTQQVALNGVLDEVGWVQQILVNQRTGHVVDGHLRVTLALRRNEPTVPVTYVDLTEQEEALILATLDPIGALAGTDDEMLNGLLRDVSASDKELVAFLASLSSEKPLILEDEVPDPPVEPITKPGDLWLLREHRLLCGDSTKAEDVARLMNGQQADMVFADPPYGVSIVRGLGSSVGGPKPFGRNHVGTIGGSNMIDVGHYAPVIGDESTDTAVAAATVALNLWPKAVQIWWGGNYYAHMLPPSSCWIAWDKQNTGNFGDAELAWTNQKTAVRVFRHMWNGLMKASERGERRVHPTQKPVALAGWVYETYGTKGDLVVDPFVGSGMSLVAAAQTERVLYGCELSPAYCDVIVKRWENLTGRKATREKPIRKARRNGQAVEAHA